MVYALLPPSLVVLPPIMLAHTLIMVEQCINQFLRPRLSLLDSEAVLLAMQAATKSERLTVQSLRNTDSPQHPLLDIIRLPL